MRQILIDELTLPEIDRVNEYFKNNARPSSMDGLYWVDVPVALQDPDQAAAPGDQPFCFAIEVGESWVKIELLVRSLHNMRSPFTRYANRAQRRFILDLSERMIGDLNLKT